MSTRQPVWKLVANLGDASPLDYGGYFVYVDETGVYPPEAELLEEPCEGEVRYTVHRVVLDRCTLTDGILSDNRFHPTHAAWFAKPEAERAARPQDTTYVSNVAQYLGLDEAELTAAFCSEDPVKLADAYRAVGDYHGWDNLDGYPLTLSKREVRARYTRGEL